MSHNSRALVVEDEAFLREALTEILEEDFSTVHSVGDGASALKALETFDPDLILSDIKMPGFDGIEMVRRLRAKGNNVPVIFVTAHGDKEIVLNALRLGAGDVIEKPFDIDTVKATVHRVLQITARSEDLLKLKQEYGEDSPEVRRHERILGLLKAVGSTQKV